MTAPQPDVSRAGPLHAALLAEIHARAFPPDERWDARLMAGQLGQPGVFGLIETRGGMVLARVAADEAEILTLAVVPERRRQGIGASLIEAAAAEGLRRGAVRLFLEVNMANLAAQALYAAQGFARVGLRRGYYADRADALVLSKTLKAQADQ